MSRKIDKHHRCHAAWIRNQRGATAIEYALLVSLIAVAALMSLQLSGSAVAGTMENASAAMPAQGMAVPAPTKQ